MIELDAHWTCLTPPTPWPSYRLRGTCNLKARFEKSRSALPLCEETHGMRDACAFRFCKLTAREAEERKKDSCNSKLMKRSRRCAIWRGKEISCCCEKKERSGEIVCKLVRVNDCIIPCNFFQSHRLNFNHWRLESFITPDIPPDVLVVFGDSKDIRSFKHFC